MNARPSLVRPSVLLLAAPIIAWVPAASAQSKPLFPGPHYKLVSQVPFATNVFHGELADLDGDNRLDHVATMFFNPGSIALSFGDGLGGFAPPQYIPTVGQAAGLALPDVNGDGRPDLAIGNVTHPAGESKIGIHLGLGAGQFGAPTYFGFGGIGGHDLRSLDIDVDGDADLATHLQNSGSFVQDWRFLLGDGAGSFTLSPSQPAATNLNAFGDLTGDGAPEMFEVAFTGQLVGKLWLNDGAGILSDQGVVLTFASAFTTGIGLGDLNVDGALDAVLLELENDVEVALGNGGGGFSAPVVWPVAHASEARSPVFADFTGDGLVDVATSSTTSGATPDAASVIPGDGAGGFGPAVNYFVGATPDAPVAGDLNGDGRLDLAMVSMELGGIALLLSDGAAGFPKNATEPVGANPGRLQLADLNGDAHRDALLLTGSSSFFLIGFDGLATALGDGQGGFGAASAYTPTMRPMSALVADWTGDFDLDVVLAATTASAHELQLWQGDGVGGLSHVSTHAAGATPLSDAASEDVDGDGRRDLLFVPGTSTGPSSVSWTAGDGLGGFGPATSPVPCDSDGCARTIAVADLNADGKRDLVVATSGITFTPPALKSYLGDGAGGFAFAFKSTAIGQNQFRLADLSGDGFPDVLVHGQNNGLAVALGLGNGAFGPLTSYGFYASTSLLNGGGPPDLGDLDGDGRLDVVTSASASGTLYVYRGDGVGGFVRDRGYAAPMGQSSAVGDVDEDGQLDVVAADATGQALTVLENLEPCAGTVQTYGLGCPGTSGFVPSLSVFGCPEPGKTLSVRLSGGLGGSVGFVLHGLVPAHIPIPGGCEFLIDQLLPAVTAMPLSAGAAGAGAKTLTFAIGPVGPSGADFAMQAVVFDPVAAFSFASTNGVRLVIQ